MASVPQVRIAIIGAGFAGMGMAIRLKQRGRARLRHPRALGGDRRDLAGQHVPRLRRGRGVPPLLVLVRAEPGLDAALLPAAGDLGLPAAARGRARARPSTCAWATRSSAPTGTRTPGCGTCRRRAGTVDARFLVSGMGPLTNPVDAGHPRPGDVRRNVLSLRQLGPRPRPDRRARRRHRHRLLGGAVRPRDRAARRAHCSSSSARRPGSCRA